MHARMSERTNEECCPLGVQHPPPPPPESFLPRAPAAPACAQWPRSCRRCGRQGGAKRGGAGMKGQRPRTSGPATCSRQSPLAGQPCGQGWGARPNQLQTPPGVCRGRHALPTQPRTSPPSQTAQHPPLPHRAAWTASPCGQAAATMSIWEATVRDMHEKGARYQGGGRAGARDGAAACLRLHGELAYPGGQPLTTARFTAHPAPSRAPRSPP